MKLTRRRQLQSKIKANLIEKHDKVCFFCGTWYSQVDLVHIIRQSYSEELSVVQENCVLGCRYCHNTFDDASGKKLASLHNIDKALEIMRGLDGLYYNRFKDKMNNR